MSAKLVVILILIVGVSANLGVLAKTRPPKIYLNEEYVMHCNQNLKIKCEASEPISWTCPNSTQMTLKTYSHISISTNDKDNKYVAVLNIVNASFIDTGFYYCHGIGDDFNSNRSSKIYLFVKDDENLTVLDDMEIIYSDPQDTDVILPCRPTSPDTNVKLYKITDDSEVRPGQNQKDGSIIKFDPRFGFIFVTHAYEEIYEALTIVYLCSFFRDHVTQNITVLHNIQPMQASFDEPYIEDLNLGHSVEGDTLRLKCTLICSAHFTMSWMVPNPDGFETGRITESGIDSTDLNTHFKILTIKNVTKADQGRYTCLVEGYMNKNANSLNVKIFDTDDHFIYLLEENNVYNITQRAGIDPVQWCIKVNAHPIKHLQAEWYNNKNELIESVEGTKYKISFTPTEAILKINKVKIEDFGNYTLVVRNGFETEKLHLFLTVTDTPTVHIDVNDFHFIGTQTKAKCTSTGYPLPTIFWSFKPECLNNSCPSKKIFSSKLQRNGLQVISEISIKASETGLLTCFANNTLGRDYETVPFYVTDVFNGFNISNSPNLIEAKNSTLKKVAKGETLELYCSAFVYNCKNVIEWYRGSQKIVNTDDREYVVRSKTKYSYKTKLVLSNVTKGDDGDYWCKVLDNNNVQKELYVTLKVLEPRAPEIISTNLEETLEIKLPEGLNLECFFAGIPKPDIIWYKDGIEIIPDENRTRITHNGQVLFFQGTIESDEGTYRCNAKNKVGQASKQVAVSFTNRPSGKAFYIIITCLLVLAFVCVILIILTIKIRTERKLQAELKAVGLEHFEKGQVKS